MISTFTAFFDANVLYSARLRSLIGYTAQTKLFRARWSEMVHDEWTRNLIQNRPGLSPQSLQRTRESLNAAVPDCVVTGFEGLIGALTLPDPNDRHVLAAAIVGRANVIVTFNQKDFPQEVLEPYGLHTNHPDEFFVNTLELGEPDFRDEVLSDFWHYRDPRLTFDEYRASLAKAGVPRLAELLQAFEILIAPDELRRG